MHVVGLARARRAPRHDENPASWRRFRRAHRQGPDRGLARTDFGQDAAGDYRPRYRLGIRAAGAGKPYFDESPQWFLRNGRANQADGRTGGLAHITEIGRAHVELQSLTRISYAGFCLNKKQTTIK